MGRGVAFESILAPLSPVSPQLPKDYLVGAVATNPTPDLTPHSVGGRGTRTQPCRFGNAIAESCCVVSSHAEPPRALGMRGQFCVCAATAAMRRRLPDSDSRHVPCLLDSGVGLRWFERKGMVWWIDWTGGWVVGSGPRSVLHEDDLEQR